MPRPVARLPLLDLPAPVGRQPLSYLFDVGFTRDVWMHRVDLAHATERPMDLDAAHDGRIVADLVAEWAALHGEPFVLTLEGPAGGVFAQGTGGEVVALEAIQFCPHPCRTRRRRRRAAAQAPALTRTATEPNP